MVDKIGGEKALSLATDWLRGSTEARRRRRLLHLCLRGRLRGRLKGRLKGHFKGRLRGRLKMRLKRCLTRRQLSAIH